MTKVPKYWNEAKKSLSKKDKIMSKLIKNYQGPSEIILTSRKDIFFITAVDSELFSHIAGSEICSFNFWRSEVFDLRSKMPPNLIIFF